MVQNGLELLMVLASFDDSSWTVYNSLNSSLPNNVVIGHAWVQS